MKLVKKLLRILPLIVIVCLFLISAFSMKLNITYDSTINFQTIFSSIVSGFYNALIVNSNNIIFDYSSTILGPLISRVNSIFGIGSTFVIRFAWSTLIYELWLSIAFLMFDLFNFILSVAERFINKGERSND